MAIYAQMENYAAIKDTEGESEIVQRVFITKC